MSSIKHLCLSTCFWLVVAGTVMAAETSQMDAKKIFPNYAPPFQAAARPALLTLPPGAIQPQGWLRDWALSIKDGYTACMDEIDEEFKRAWTPNFKPTGKNLNWMHGSWSMEGGGYWFDGLVQLGYALNDASLQQQAKRRLYDVADNMDSNGILFLSWLDRNAPENWKAIAAANEGFPLGTSGLLGNAMCKYYAATGDKHILAALEKAYGSDPRALLRAKHRTTNLFPAYYTYTWTGNPGVAVALDTMFKEGCDGALPKASKFFSVTPDGRPMKNVHGVMVLRHLAPWTVGYLWTGNVNYLKAVLAWDNWLDRVAMQPYGVPVADEWYHPTGAFRGTETCDVALYLEEQADLLSLTGDGKMADHLERAFFNAAPATVSRDCITHVYYQCPNRFAKYSPRFPDGTRETGTIYKRKHSPLCCTASLNRIVPDYIAQMWKATNDNGLAATCYGPCRVSALVADHVPVTIECKTDYPFNEVIEMSLDLEKPTTFPLCFHIPGWCKAPKIKVNDTPCEIQKNEKGFLRVERQWQKGDAIQLRFPMTTVVQTGRDISVELSKSPTHKPVHVGVPQSEKEGKPYATVSYGPLLFALPIPDTTDANTLDRSVRWQFALDTQNPDIKVERTAMPARWDWPLAATIQLTVSAMPIDWTPDLKYPTLPGCPFVKDKKSERVTLVPYGCTKFRISMFPITAE